MNSKAITSRQEDPILSLPMEPKEDNGDPGMAEFQDDEFFIRSALRSDPKVGVELLYSRYYSALCTHAIKFVGSREIAEDIVSDIFYRFYSGRIFERVTTSYRAYLFRTVRNQGYNYLKWESAKKIPMEDSFDLTSSESQQPDNITQYEELYQDVEKAIATLPLRQRSIYLLFHFEGKSVKEIALELSISARTAEVQVYRARNTVRALIRNKWFISILIALTIL